MAEKSVDSITEVFKCFICIEKLTDARICPHCSKLCCYRCIRRWLTEQQSICPHCRSSVRLSEMIKCRWAEEVTQHLTALSSNKADDVVVGKDESDSDNICNIHREKLSVYCAPCESCICHHCALWGGMHSGHTLKPLDEIYDEKSSRVKEELKRCRLRQAELISLKRDAEKTAEVLRNAKEDRVREMRVAVSAMILRLDTQLQTRFNKLYLYRDKVSQESDLLQSMTQEIEHQLRENSKSEMISKSSNILDMASQIIRLPLPHAPELNSEFLGEIVPGYETQQCVLRKFSQLRQKADPVYSDSLVMQGLSWRIKIYPDGNGVVRGNYLSVFLELTYGRPETCKYEYRIEMIHQRSGDASRNVIREFASDFDVGECWGYNRFFKLDYLASEGFLDQDNDTLAVQFQVRSPTYFHRCQDLLWLNDKLESRNGRLSHLAIPLSPISPSAEQTERSNSVINQSTSSPIVTTTSTAATVLASPCSTTEAQDPVLNSSVHSPARCLWERESSLEGLVIRASEERDVDDETMSMDNDVEQSISLASNWSFRDISDDFIASSNNVVESGSSNRMPTPSRRHRRPPQATVVGGELITRVIPSPRTHHSHLDPEERRLLEFLHSSQCHSTNYSQFRGSPQQQADGRSSHTTKDRIHRSSSSNIRHHHNTEPSGRRLASSATGGVVVRTDYNRGQTATSDMVDRIQQAFRLSSLADFSAQQQPLRRSTGDRAETDGSTNNGGKDVKRHQGDHSAPLSPVSRNLRVLRSTDDRMVTSCMDDSGGVQNAGRKVSSAGKARAREWYQSPHARHSLNSPLSSSSTRNHQYHRRQRHLNVPLQPSMPVSRSSVATSAATGPTADSSCDSAILEAFIAGAMSPRIGDHRGNGGGRSSSNMSVSSNEGAAVGGTSGDPHRLSVNRAVSPCSSRSSDASARRERHARYRSQSVDSPQLTVRADSFVRLPTGTTLHQARCLTGGGDLCIQTTDICNSSSDEDTCDYEQMDVKKIGGRIDASTTSDSESD